MSKRHLSVVPAPAPHRLDLCECGHTCGSHRGVGTCIAFVPAFPLKKARQLLDGATGFEPCGHAGIDRASANALASDAQARVHGNKSSVCGCLTFRPSGYRVVVPDDPEEQRAIATGRKQRIVELVA